MLHNFSPRFSPYSHSCPSAPSHLAGQDTSRPSETYLSPPSAYYLSLHPTTNPVTRYHHPFPPYPNTQSIHATQPSTFSHQGSYPRHPATNVPFSDLHASQPSNTIHQPEGVINENYPAHQQALYMPQEQASTRQGQTYVGNGVFRKARNLSVANSTFIDNSISSDNFMNEFLQHTIIGAEFDSSARHPPPRCLPGTRLAIIERCKMFIEHCTGEEKMRWVVGAAGVGKSAVMQIVAEETPADASVFLSVNGRQDGTKTFTTIAYQLAAKYAPYRQFIRSEISRDPSLLQKSLPVQFEKFIVDPFVRHPLFNTSRRFLIIIDGLDECDNSLVQRELLELISDFCISYPISPIVWIVASRPEPHITSLFDDMRVAPAFTKEVIEIDSNEACEDVQRYLRDELNKIKLAYPMLRRKREWPSELEFTKIATAAGGLFAYASTVVRSIGDPHYRNPVAQLRHVLEAICTGLKHDVPGRDYPMAQLDALYQRILSNIPVDVMVTTRKLLLISSEYGWHWDYFRWQCNRLGLTEDAAYGAVCHLHAVLKVPAPDEVDYQRLEYLHKSFEDFLFDYNRSKFSHNIQDEVERLQVQSSLRIVNQVPDDLDSMTRGEGIRCHPNGFLKGGWVFCDNISLSWPGDERFRMTDDQLRFNLYSESIDNLCDKFGAPSEFYWNMNCFHVLTTRFTAPGSKFPFYELRQSAFEKFRSELIELGKLKQVPLQALDYAAICGFIEFRFIGPFGLDVNVSDPWNPSCEHGRYEEEDGDQWRGWSTSVGRFLTGPGDDVADANILRFNVKAGKDSHWNSTLDLGCHTCPDCLRRLACHFFNNPDQLATVFVDSTEMSYVELSFVDPDDGVSEWRYRFFHSGAPSSY